MTKKEVLDRAKLAMPFGYITKPFQKKELKATIEMALYVAAMDARRRQAEIKLKKYRDELEKKVEERTRQLIAVNQQLNEEIEKRRAINSELRKTNEKLEMQHRLYRQDNEIAQMILKKRGQKRSHSICKRQILPVPHGTGRGRPVPGIQRTQRVSIFFHG